MKILINRKPVQGPWGGGNLFVTAFCDIMAIKGHEIVHQFSDDLDVIFLQDPRYDSLGISIKEVAEYKNNFPNVKVFHRVNECDARKGTEGMDVLLRHCNSFTTKTFFVSNWIQNYHLKRGWECLDACVVLNGVDNTHFVPSPRDNKKIKLVTHHWSNNQFKGFDVYNWLDDFVSRTNKFTFTYIGRENGTFKNTEVIEPLFGKDLGEELTKYDVYISGSRFDPGPNHILESLACGIPTYAHREGGGAVDFVGLDHTYATPTELQGILEKKIEFNADAVIPGSWEECIDNYCLEMGL